MEQVAQSKPCCPRCGQIERVARASALYLFENQADTRSEINHLGLSSAALQSLRRRMAPPHAPAFPPWSRPLHPDLVLLFVSSLLPVFLTGIARSQPSALLPVILLLLSLYALYMLQRKNLLRRYQQDQQSRCTRVQQAQQALETWLHTWYCAGCDETFQADI